MIAKLPRRGSGQLLLFDPVVSQGNNWTLSNVVAGTMTGPDGQTSVTWNDNSVVAFGFTQAPLNNNVLVADGQAWIFTGKCAFNSGGGFFLARLTSEVAPGGERSDLSIKSDMVTTFTQAAGAWRIVDAQVRQLGPVWSEFMFTTVISGGNGRLIARIFPAAGLNTTFPGFNIAALGQWGVCDLQVRKL